ncbi:MAG TPA: right-handed parallel beta-helix repeat-containing protein [Thermoanaerobaculia bacterium]|jgi:hypothetical protein
MRTSARILILCTLLVCLSTTAYAATRYVATTGNNANAGTLSSPWATIQYGVNQLAAGDTLYVRGGTYMENVLMWNKHGSSTAVIYVVNYPNESPVIDGTGKTESGFVINESSYIYFGGFEVRNNAKSGVFIWDAHHVEVAWNDVHGNQKFGIHAGTDTFGLTHDVVIRGNEVYDNVRHNVNGTASPWMQALSAYQADKVEIVGNYVHENYGEGIDYIVSDEGNIHENYIWDNKSVNLYLDNATSTKVDRNFIVTGWSSHETDFYRDGHPNPGIAAANEYYDYQNPLNNLTITNNIVLFCSTGFVYWNSQYAGGLQNTTIANNTFYGATDYALFWIEDDNHANTVVKNNIFRQTSGLDMAWAPTNGITYAYNNWYGGNANTHMSGTGDVLSNPLFVNAGGSDADDYKLTSTSPCRNTGTTVSAVTTDYWGTARSATYDIGAHEY